MFVGHGSPMNAIDDNEYTAHWEMLSKWIPKPKAILAISAHWYTSGTRTHDEQKPKLIYDMYGFPEKLYKVQYPVAGAPDLARQTLKILSRPTVIDNTWGIDHGTWSVLVKMYPKADIPVYQLSIDSSAPAPVHFQLGQELSTLRNEGVLIMGSGNIVHNLGLLQWNMEGGFPWAKDFDAYIKENIIKSDFDNVVHYEKAGQAARYAFNTPDHFYPLLYVLGAAGVGEKVQVFNESCMMGSMSMTGYLMGDAI